MIINSLLYWKLHQFQPLQPVWSEETNLCLLQPHPGSGLSSGPCPNRAQQWGLICIKTMTRWKPPDWAACVWAPNLHRIQGSYLKTLADQQSTSTSFLQEVQTFPELLQGSALQVCSSLKKSCCSSLQEVTHCLKGKCLLLLNILCIHFIACLFDRDGYKIR